MTLPGGAQRPCVSVVIATYNRSEVLRYAIESVLAQHFADFELLVVGDACTDDTEAVVRGFDDPRVRWENLPRNAGSQWAPNNRGLELARGRYVAYLGHDDLWHPDHLAVLVAAIERDGADLVFALTEEVGPPSRPTRGILGLCPGGAYEWSLWAPPSSWLHRQEVIGRIGPWRDYRTIVLPTDVEFLTRAYEAGLAIVPVPELTVFKFTSVARSNSYVERSALEQATWCARLQREPDLRYREALAILGDLAASHPEIAQRFRLPGDARPGTLGTRYRLRRGLPGEPAGPPGAPADGPLYGNRALLRYLNVPGDIGPESSRRVLHEQGELPPDGLFLGFNWHSLELDADGVRWRWMDQDAQIVVTRPSGARRSIALDLIPGPGLVRRRWRLQAHDAEGKLVDEVAGRSRGVITLDLPLIDGPGSVFRIGTGDGGRIVPGDPRVLNFRVFALDWAR